MTLTSQGSAVIELHRGPTLAVQVFDLKNGLCLLEHGND